MRRVVQTFCEDESGISAIEFALVAAILSISIIGNLQTLKTALNGFYSSAASHLSN